MGEVRHQLTTWSSFILKHRDNCELVMNYRVFLECFKQLKNVQILVAILVCYDYQQSSIYDINLIHDSISDNHQLLHSEHNQ